MLYGLKCPLVWGCCCCELDVMVVLVVDELRLILCNDVLLDFVRRSCLSWMAFLAEGVVGLIRWCCCCREVLEGRCLLVWL